MEMRDFLVVFVLYLSFLLHHASGDLIVEEKLALLDFAARIKHDRSLNWAMAIPACGNWVGVVCSADERVGALNLAGYGFTGDFPLNTLGRLTAIKALILRDNAFTGPFPADLLSIPTLTVVDFSFNHFNGSIPPSLCNLTSLNTLYLSDNSFSGYLPDTLANPSLRRLSVADNQLTGSVPDSILNRFPLSSFAGNKFTNVAFSSSPAPTPQASPVVVIVPWYMMIREIIILLLGGGVLYLFSLGLLRVLRYYTRKNIAKSDTGDHEKNTKSPAESEEFENNKLVFFGKKIPTFQLDDLLRSPTELLGKGLYGWTYKAVFEGGSPVVVKKLNVGSVVWKDEFVKTMEMVGRVQHDNVVPLRAYSTNHMLVLYDYYNEGSVFSLLHGKRDQERKTGLDWPSRFKIVLGTARAIAYIHSENSGKLVHGNIKTTNIFRNSNGYGCVSNLGLATFMKIPSDKCRKLAYQAPELLHRRKATRASDVYSVGVVLFELLTGYPPAVTTGDSENVNLSEWVQRALKEEWTSDVFDKELIKDQKVEDETLIGMLKIGLACVAQQPGNRPSMEHVVRMIEDIGWSDARNPAIVLKIG